MKVFLEDIKLECLFSLIEESVLCFWAESARIRNFSAVIANIPYLQCTNVLAEGGREGEGEREGGKC